MIGAVFFFNDTATTEIYTLSLHDALPICTQSANDSMWRRSSVAASSASPAVIARRTGTCDSDRKSTRLNSSHANISYAVFCLKKKIDAEALVVGDVQVQQVALDACDLADA